MVFVWRLTLRPPPATANMRLPPAPVARAHLAIPARHSHDLVPLVARYAPPPPPPTPPPQQPRRPR